MSEILLAPIEFGLPELSRLKILWEYFLFEVVPRSQVINSLWLAQRSTDLGGGDVNYKFVVPSVNGSEKKNCDWAVRIPKRKKKRCNIEAVRINCPKNCDLC